MGLINAHLSFTKKFKPDSFTTMSKLDLSTVHRPGAQTGFLCWSPGPMASHITRVNVHPSLARSRCSADDWLHPLLPQVDPPVPYKQGQDKSLAFILTQRRRTTRCPELPPSAGHQRLPGGPSPAGLLPHGPSLGFSHRLGFTAGF